ncbi:hypothetical protein JOC54_002340 [Alkalihalobacillus xiaoxiensis]|uniref:Uncharacterized protein n=1 Tax=Shouchella xiaoxiensis TaxID=766895 RepID=A0ABS2SW91_9BACI|nr:hypothetical protein [Shouchella xiaoxiensis]MBM7839070.1 hypothetical protein [Shouchella xiaoxiensis]
MDLASFIFLEISNATNDFGCDSYMVIYFIELFINFCIGCMYGLNISAGMGLLFYSAVYRRIYESLVIKNPDTVFKKIWNGFYHTTGGGLSYFLYYWLRANFKSWTVNLLFIFYIIFFIVIGFFVAVLAATLVDFVFDLLQR